VLILRVAIVSKKAKAFVFAGNQVLLRIEFVFCSPLRYNPGTISVGTEKSVAHEILVHRHLHLGGSEGHA
jgi:hypothetical protein